MYSFIENNEKFSSAIDAYLTSLSLRQKLELVPSDVRENIGRQVFLSLERDQLVDVIFTLQAQIQKQNDVNTITTIHPSSHQTSTSGNDNITSNIESRTVPQAIPNIHMQPVNQRKAVKVPDNSSSNDLAVTSVGLVNTKKLTLQYNEHRAQLMDQLVRVICPYPSVCTVTNCKLCFSWFFTSAVTPCSSKYKCHQGCTSYGWYPHITSRGIDQLKKYHLQKRIIHAVVVTKAMADMQPPIISTPEWVESVHGIDGNRRRWIRNISELLFETTGHGEGSDEVVMSGNQTIGVSKHLSKRQATSSHQSAGKKKGSKLPRTHSDQDSLDID